MSEHIGPLAVAASGAISPLLPGAQEVSEATQHLVDQEVRRIVDEAESEVIALLERERERLERLARALLEKETLDQLEAYAAAGVAPPAEPDQEGQSQVVAPPELSREA